LEWHNVVQELIQKEKWIIDGNFNSTLVMRIERADTVIFLDAKRKTCLWNVTKRIMKGKYFKAKRSDLTRGCNEKFDAEFFRWIWNYNKKMRPHYLKLLNSLKDKKQVIVFRNYKQRDKFLAKLRKEN